MKVLHVSAFDSGGGAARAAVRIHEGLLDAGIKSSFMTIKPSTDVLGVFTPLSRREVLTALMKRRVASHIARLQTKPTNQVIHSLGMFSSGLLPHINSSDADIVHLHWICAEALSISDIAKIRKPIAWTLHDMWPLMGTEHYDDQLYQNRWLGDYRRENRPINSSGIDIDKIIWQRKAKSWRGVKFNFVSPSQWLSKCVSRSALLGQHDCRVIPNPLDTRKFSPVATSIARNILGLPTEPKLILFGAYGATTDLRKGYDLLIDTVNKLSDVLDDGNKIELLIFGNGRLDKNCQINRKCHFLGTVHDDVTLRLIYSAADLFIAPSRQDNLPNTIVEATSCGLPTVAFDIGGMPDMIINNETGALVRPFSTDAMMTAVQTLLAHPVSRSKVRDFAKAKYSYDKVIPSYISLYQQILSA
jgi:glycosyltransferase involved in cell wall biosynthesis